MLAVGDMFFTSKCARHPLATNRAYLFVPTGHRREAPHTIFIFFTFFLDPSLVLRSCGSALPSASLHFASLDRRHPLPRVCPRRVACKGRPASSGTQRNATKCNATQRSTLHCNAPLLPFFAPHLDTHPYIQHAACSTSLALTPPLACHPPRNTKCVSPLFASAPVSSKREFLFRVSYLEIYNEQINDLLCPASTMANVRILESKKLGVQLQGVKEEVVISPQQVYALISAGEAQRHVGSTDANKVEIKKQRKSLCCCSGTIPDSVGVCRCTQRGSERVLRPSGIVKQ